MTVVRGALSPRRLIEEHPALALLRSANAPVAVAILGQHPAGEKKQKLVMFCLAAADGVQSYASEVSVDDHRLGAHHHSADQQALFEAER